MNADTGQVLTINTGSSSLKAAVFRWTPEEPLTLAARVERIGLPAGRLAISDGRGRPVYERALDLPDHAAALDALFAWLQAEHGDSGLHAIGHRVVHGGPRYHAPEIITPPLVAALRELVPIDPEHLPQALAAVEAAGRAYPSVPQVACFDTAFHRTMPPVAQRYPLPSALHDAGVIRYGFHGLSYEYIMQALRAVDPEAANGRVIIAHLGNGASMAAVRGGQSVDTTMGFTPTGGLVMGTRTGDLDPGVLLYLLQTRGMPAEQVNDLVNRQAGLLGVSGISADMRDLLEREAHDPAAAAAVDLFCYQARKFLGALAAVLGGVETLVFTGGIGEHAAPIRARICVGLAFLGLEIDAGRNQQHAPVISPDSMPVTVRVIPTDEDRMIARHTYRLITHEGAADVHV
jgi:acetate kinase